MTDKLKHTPGPWTPAEKNASNVIDIEDSSGRVVASLYDPNETTDQMRVDAHLVAAVPDMKDALVVLASAVKQYCEWYDRFGDGSLQADRVSNILRNAGETARKAIAMGDLRNSRKPFSSTGTIKIN